MSFVLWIINKNVFISHQLDEFTNFYILKFGLCIWGFLIGYFKYRCIITSHRLEIFISNSVLILESILFETSKGHQPSFLERIAFSSFAIFCCCYCLFILDFAPLMKINFIFCMPIPKLSDILSIMKDRLEKWKMEEEKTTGYTL